MVSELKMKKSIKKIIEKKTTNINHNNNKYNKNILNK